MRAWVFAPLLWLLALPAWADARMTVLVDLLELRQAAVILSDEGQAHAEMLNQDMLGGQGGPGWQMQVESIHDAGRMVEMVRRALEETMTSAEVEQAIDFYSTELGGRIVGLENAGRAAIAEPEVEQIARAHYGVLAGDHDPRVALIRRLIDAADMVDRNVSTALNSNFQFLRGMRDGGALEDSDEDLLAEVGAELGVRRLGSRGQRPDHEHSRARERRDVLPGQVAQSALHAVADHGVAHGLADHEPDAHLVVVADQEVRHQRP